MENLPKKIKITEVGPRDGLQNEPENIPTNIKLDFIKGLEAAGLKQIETTSFVSPKWVPQMADSQEVALGTPPKKGMRYIALTPNEKGLDLALSCGLEAIAIFTAASDTFNLKNTNINVEDSLKRFEPLIKRALDLGLWVRGYVSTVIACPYEGQIKPEKVLEVSQRLFDLGIKELSLGDTIGVGTPKQVEALLELILKKIDPNKLAMHFHDTRGTALANVYQSLQMGVSHFDASAGGLGGCPYAKGASGNLATEDLVYFLDQMGLESGVNLEKLAKASAKIAKLLHRPLPSKVWRTLIKNF
ncbi:MAG: hydroxymethylglutaryl-CoA lyase [Deltaproteobacteria bacterium]|nr:hydroxymethylglutaryl-CoA lyase [Deltaproteobacteria bacterium]